VLRLWSIVIRSILLGGYFIFLVRLLFRLPAGREYEATEVAARTQARRQRTLITCKNRRRSGFLDARCGERVPYFATSGVSELCVPPQLLQEIDDVGH